MTLAQEVNLEGSEFGKRLGVKVLFNLKPGISYLPLPSPILLSTGVCSKVYASSSSGVELEWATFDTLAVSLGSATVPH